MYLVMRTDQGGGYLGANPGVAGNTWVRTIATARLFTTHDLALAACCPENEVPVALESACRGWPQP